MFLKIHNVKMLAAVNVTDGCSYLFLLFLVHSQGQVDVCYQL